MSSKKLTSLVSVGALLFALSATVAGAQSIENLPNTNVHAPATIDENNVELTTGSFTPPMKGASIGTSDSGMVDSFGGYGIPKSSDFLGGVAEAAPDACDNHVFPTPYCDVWADPVLGQDLQPSPYKDDATVVVHIGRYKGTFQRTSTPFGSYQNIDGTSETLTGSGASDPGMYELTMSDGTVVDFYNSGVDINSDAKFALPSQIKKPDGEIITFSYDIQPIATNLYDPTVPGGPPEYYEKLTRVTATSSLGWRTIGNLIDGTSDFHMYNVARSTQALVSYNAALASSQNLTRTSQPQSDGTYTFKERLWRGIWNTSGGDNIRIYQDFESRTNVTCSSYAVWDFYDQTWISSNDCYLHWVAEFTHGMKEILTSGRTILATYYEPDDNFSSTTTTIPGGCTYSPFMVGRSCVKYIDRGGQRWTYNYINGGIQRVDPLGNTRFVKGYFSDQMGSLPTQITDELGRTTLFEYNPYERLTKVTYPTGAHTDYEYNDRQDLTKLSIYPSDGGAAQITQFGYDAVCNNLKTCNKPNWTKDPNGAETDYTYDPNHGGVTSITLPSANGFRTQKRFYYSQLYPKDINGNTVNSPVWRLTEESSCRSSTNSCSGTADEEILEYAYNDRNLMLTSVTKRAGDNSVSATTSYGYDFIGNRVMIDGPRTDVDDRSYTTYDSARRPVYEIGVDPDGSGPLQRVVIHHVYDVDGNEIRTETGTGSAITFDGDGAPTGVSDFAVTSFKRMTFDPSTGLLVKTEVVQP